jgi:N-methylhydantoinase B/oxoprolinase/acetone carboxylase alpha subunit
VETSDEGVGGGERGAGWSEEREARGFGERSVQPSAVKRAEPSADTAESSPGGGGWAKMTRPEQSRLRSKTGARRR